MAVEPLLAFLLWRTHHVSISCGLHSISSNSHKIPFSKILRFKKSVVLTLAHWPLLLCWGINWHLSSSLGQSFRLWSRVVMPPYVFWWNIPVLYVFHEPRFQVPSPPRSPSLKISLVLWLSEYENCIQYSSLVCPSHTRTGSSSPFVQMIWFY